MVAFSGGADSAFLAKVATDELGAENVLCVTAVSPSLAPEELADVRSLAAEWSLRHVEVLTDELDDPMLPAERRDALCPLQERPFRRRRTACRRRSARPSSSA